MAVKVYDDEYNIGYLCKNFQEIHGEIKKCRRPKGHEGEHQGFGWKWWFDPSGIMRKIELDVGE